MTDEVALKDAVLAAEHGVQGIVLSNHGVRDNVMPCGLRYKSSDYEPFRIRDDNLIGIYTTRGSTPRVHTERAWFVQVSSTHRRPPRDPEAPSRPTEQDGDLR